ncbi:Protein of unknown function DUF58 [Catalinimonas alkaloidigena]|uniref:DUF58 domain-containing protein n=1 Tax=Catalinimonas alkaloidigena TaxID=1075417 RepID=A0A1G8WCZ9_9BACT|nr:DUF58 domain-containing protein [Catalinimonas alkaloidigena]SDJ76093.1 Protein of unknown function DUF58 [Catalinimonas alkaloidigena]
MKIDLQQVKQFGNIEFLARQMVEGFITGLHKSPYHGFSVEFAEHKIYNPGESTRHIDWKVYGKTDRLYTKRYEEETNLRCQILIDTSSSMYYPTATQGKLTFSIMAAAALTYMLQKQRDAVGLTTFSETVEQQTPVSSTPSHVHKIFLLLERLLPAASPERKTSVATVLHQIADSMNRRALVIIFSDMFEDLSRAEELFAALQHLKHNQHEVLLFHVVDGKTELEFNFDDRPHEFIDVETGERVKVRPSQIREHYRTQMEAFRHELMLRCGQYKIDFIEADINQDINHILLPYLVKRSKMR